MHHLIKMNVYVGPEINGFEFKLKEYLKNKVKMSCYIQPDQSSGLILIMKNIFAMTHELGDVNARRRLFVSHSHDIVLLFACLRIGVSWHNFNVTTAKRMLIGVSKSHKISKGYDTRITSSAEG